MLCASIFVIRQSNKAFNKNKKAVNVAGKNVLDPKCGVELKCA